MEAIRDAEQQAIREAEVAVLELGLYGNAEFEEHENDVAHGADIDTDASNSGNNGEDKRTMEKDV